MIYRVSAHFKELFKMKILVIVDMQNDFIAARSMWRTGRSEMIFVDDRRIDFTSFPDGNVLRLVRMGTWLYRRTLHSLDLICNKVNQEVQL